MEEAPGGTPRGPSYGLQGVQVLHEFGQVGTAHVRHVATEVEELVRQERRVLLAYQPLKPQLGHLGQAIALAGGRVRHVGVGSALVPAVASKPQWRGARTLLVMNEGIWAMSAVASVFRFMPM